MKLFVLLMALFAGQLQGPQGQSVIRLSPPHASSIPETAGGQLVELLNAPAGVALPHPTPKRDLQGNTWYVDVRNLGPNDVSLEQAALFAQVGPQVIILLHPRDTARIRANGSGYVVVKR
jgi:hypothetical protein